MKTSVLLAQFCKAFNTSLPSWQAVLQKPANVQSFFRHGWRTTDKTGQYHRIYCLAVELNKVKVTAAAFRKQFLHSSCNRLRGSKQFWPYKNVDAFQTVFLNGLFELRDIHDLTAPLCSILIIILILALNLALSVFRQLELLFLQRHNPNSPLSRQA